jgi:hypothetical protein
MIRFYNKPSWLVIAVAFLLLLILTTPALAGEPDKTIGGINPNLYVCLTEDNKVVDVENDAVTDNGDGTVSYDPDKTVDLNKLKGDCEEEEEERDENLTVALAHQSRVEGLVVEFHLDPSAVGGWRGVFSRDVPVVISGPGFEEVKGSDKDGSFFFENLGAGPVTFNLRLPPDAHPLNPNVTVVTNSFNSVTTGIYLGFFRGDKDLPPDVSTVQTPDGALLPPANFIYEDLPGSGYASLGELSGMPNVGGVLPPQQSTYVLALAAVILVVLPLAGIIKLRRNRPEN